MKLSFLVVSCVTAALAPSAAAQCSSLTTTFTANNTGGVGGQILFDLTVASPGGVLISALDTHTTGIPPSPIGIDVYTTPTTWVGKEANLAAWTLVASGTGPTAGPNMPTFLDVTDLSLPQGTYGVALILTGGAHRYTGTNANPPPTMVSNPDMTLITGAAQNTPWSGTLLTPRQWNGRLYYNCAPPVTYCTSGTTTNGCAASISASANPKVNHGAPCQITVANVEGQKTGIVFYALSSLPQPWCTTSSGTSFLCVKPPTMRTGTQSSGGAAGSCNGQLVLDWNAFQLATPGALGAPWSSGTKAYVQGWFRDPASCKTTSLSNAVELTYVP